MRSWMIALAVGLALVAAFPRLPALEWLGTALIAVALSLLLRLWILTFLLLGILYAALWGAHLLDRQLVPELEGRNLLAVGRVCSIPTIDALVLKFDFCSETLEDPTSGEVVGESLRLKLSWYLKETQTEQIDLFSGQPRAFVVRLKRLHGFLNPAGFDRETWLFRSGYGATGYVRSEQTLSRDVPWSLIASINEVRESILWDLRNNTAELKHGPSFEALTLGVKDRLDSGRWELLARTGTSHLLVISGMHIGLFSGVMFFLVRWCWLRLPAEVLSVRAELPAALCALASAGAYTLLSGMGIPAQRAFLMIVLAMAALMSVRKWRPSTLFFLAFAGVLLSEPLAVTSAGFWLSFGAVAAIGLTIAGRLRRTSSRSAQMVRIQWGITLMLAPLLLFWFGQLSWVSLLVNLVAVPLVTLWVAPLALSGMLLTAVSSSLASILFWLADWGLVAFWWLVEEAAAPAWAAQKVVVPDWWLLPMAVLAILAIAPSGTPGRIAVLVYGLAWFYPPAKYEGDDSWHFVLLDVGQGLAAYGANGKASWVYDTGPRFSDHFDAGAAVVVPNLEKVGITHLDHLLISHGDSDHAGGLDSLLASLSVGVLVSGEPARLGSMSDAKSCHEGQVFQWEGATARVLWPPPELSSVYVANRRSCVVQVQVQGWRMLLTGDIDADIERRLVRRYGEELRADVLVLAHHGSKYSSAPAFLRAVQPKIALVSAGYRNRFRHPPPETRQRLADLAIPLLNTAEHGAISLRFRPDQLDVETERVTRLGYWRQRPETPGILSWMRNP